MVDEVVTQLTTRMRLAGPGHRLGSRRKSSSCTTLKRQARSHGGRGKDWLVFREQMDKR